MSEFFLVTADIYSASSPGRLDVMGGIADYSGSLLLQMTIAETTTVQLQKRNDGLLVIRTISKDDSKDFSIDLASLKDKTYEEAGNLIRTMPGGEWAAYVVGCFILMKSEKGLETKGASILITSDIPSGKGVSSSAALEVAVLNAICKAFNMQLGRTELPLLAQKTENLVVGAPCGLMDQLSVYLGEKNKLLPLVCQPHTVFDPVPVPDGITFIGIDSGIRHAVGSASYIDVRTAAFMGYTIIALKENATIEQLKYAKEHNDTTGLPFKGFLANISPSDFEKNYLHLLPKVISGKDFLNQYQVSIDPVTMIETQKQYKVRVCTSFPVYENLRVHDFKQLIQNFSNQDDKEASLRLLGKIMFQSHTGYTAAGLGNDRTDEIVEMVQKAGSLTGVYGARVTGGGSGGTVCVLCYGIRGTQTALNIYTQFKKKYGIPIYFFSGSSHGAVTLN
jgi:galactokinase